MNNQKTIKNYPTEVGELMVHSIFKTIQGEGVLVGTPSIFIRLHGCNLQCPLCDTDYTTGSEVKNLNQILGDVENLSSGKVTTVIITGGEPFNQPLADIIELLYDGGYTVQVETNGTLYQDDVDYTKCIIVCSPKTHYVNKSLQKHIHSYKYVGGEDLLEDGLPKTVLGFNTRKRVFRPEEESIIYLQPLDSKDEEVNSINLRNVVDSCLDHNYKLCLQTHKYIGVE